MNSPKYLLFLFIVSVSAFQAYTQIITSHPVSSLFIPQSHRLIKPVFLLFTRNNVHHAEKLNSKASIRKSKLFYGFLKIKIIIHGFIDDPVTAKWMFEMKNRFLLLDDFNVIIVDWSKGNNIPYGQASVNARIVGAMVARRIKLLCKIHNSTLEDFHIVGYSLGSHVAGYAGKFLEGSLGQITGLDPAGPNFEGTHTSARLWRTDALLVDVIHTDSKMLGMFECCGHLDIYPNGGKSQPGCSDEKIIAIIARIFTNGLLNLFACDHQRAVDFYIEAITAQDTPRAFPCENYCHFEKGICSDCGENWEKCVLLGPRIVEYTGDTNSEDNFGSCNRFFLDTAAHKPYFQ